MAKPEDDDKEPAGLEPATPEEPQSSLHAQTILPQPAKSDASPEAADRTMEEETLRCRHSGDEGATTEPRRDEA